MKLSERMREWAEDSWDGLDTLEDVESANRQSVLIFADEVAQLEAENKRLREYAQHKMGCDWREGKPCDCGLDALLEQADE